jgi:polyvinyl alcohol dehydrogenase (cytochrome)
MALCERARRARASSVALVLVTVVVGCGKDEPVPLQTEEGAEAQSQDWTMFGYDLSSNFWNKAETKITTASVPQLEQAWAFDAKSQVTSTPLISGGRVYATATISAADPEVGGLFAIDLATGQQIWRNPAAGTYSALALDNGVLYMNDPQGWLRAFDATDGRQLWELHTHEGASGFSSVVVTKDLVIIGGASGEESSVPAGGTAVFRGFVLAAHKDGTLAWKTHTVEEPHTGCGVWSTPSVDEEAGVVFASTGNNYTGDASDTSDSFLAFPLSDGARMLWKKQIKAGDVFTIAQTNGNPDADFGANPILFEVDGRKLVAGGNKGGDFWVLDRKDGTILKQRNLGPNAWSPFKGGIFISGAWDGSSLLAVVNGATSSAPGSEEAAVGVAATLFAFDPLTLDVKWERQVVGPAFSPITVANGVGFFGKDKTLQAFDTATGEVLFEFLTEATIATAPAISNGYVLFGSGMPWLTATRGTKFYALKVP